MTRSFSSRPRRGLVVYQLVLILLAVVVLILVLLFFARRNQPTPGPATNPTPSMGMLHDTGSRVAGERVVA
jgi:hypothetical protein